jgi:tRNA(Ile)-lysidine synthase TilS/MesJ
MSPFEQACKAYWESGDEHWSRPDWEDESNDQRELVRQRIRAALRVLAEAELPDAVLAAAYAPLSTRDQAHMDGDALKVAFRTLLTVIAEDSDY